MNILTFGLSFQVRGKYGKHLQDEKQMNECNAEGEQLVFLQIYYNLKENELRQIERIEEGFMRKMLNTTKGCPISQLYLELGQHPARFEIQKMRILYLKYILEHILMIAS